MEEKLFSEETKIILTRWQRAKVHFDGMKLLDLDMQEVWKEYFAAVEDLLSVEEPEVLALAKEANLSIDNLDWPEALEVFKRKTKAEYDLLQISYQIVDLFPNILRSIN